MSTLTRLADKAVMHYAKADTATAAWFEYRQLASDWLDKSEESLTLNNPTLYIQLGKNVLDVEMGYVREARRHRRLGDRYRKRMVRLVAYTQPVLDAYSETF